MAGLRTWAELGLNKEFWDTQHASYLWINCQCHVQRVLKEGWLLHTKQTDGFEEAAFEWFSLSISLIFETAFACTSGCCMWHSFKVFLFLLLDQLLPIPPNCYKKKTILFDFNQSFLTLTSFYQLLSTLTKLFAENFPAYLHFLPVFFHLWGFD